jgi:hypothetical protein
MESLKYAFTYAAFISMIPLIALSQFCDLMDHKKLDKTMEDGD